MKYKPLIQKITMFNHTCILVTIHLRSYDFVPIEQIESEIGESNIASKYKIIEYFEDTQEYFIYNEESKKFVYFILPSTKIKYTNCNYKNVLQQVKDSLIIQAVTLKDVKNSEGEFQFDTIESLAQYCYLVANQLILYIDKSMNDN